MAGTRRAPGATRRRASPCSRTPPPTQPPPRPPRLRRPRRQRHRRRRWRSELRGDALGPFHLSSAATLVGGASASAEAACSAAAAHGCWSPSARRTTSRTRNLRAAGGRGHRIILATIELTKNWSSSLCLPNFDQNYSEKKTRGIPNLRSLKQAKNHQTNRNAEQERINPGFRTPNRTPKPKPQETPFFLLQEPKNRSGTASNWGGGGTR